MRQDQADRLSRILVSARAFRPFFKGILSGFRVEASWKVFTDSDIRGVFVNHKLRTVTFGKNAYTMYTFQLVDQISDEDLTYLSEKALEVPPGMMRAEAIYYKLMDQWLGDRRDASQIQFAMGDQEKQRFVFVAAYTDDEMPLVVFSRKGNQINLLPVTSEVVKKLGLDKPLVSQNTELA